MEKIIYSLEDVVNNNDMYFGSLDEVIGRLRFVLNAESNYNFKNNKLNIYAVVKYDANYEVLQASRPLCVGVWRFLTNDERNDLIQDIRKDVE